MKIMLSLGRSSMKRITTILHVAFAATRNSTCNFTGHGYEIWFINFISNSWHVTKSLCIVFMSKWEYVIVVLWNVSICWLLNYGGIVDYPKFAKKKLRQCWTKWTMYEICGLRNKIDNGVTKHINRQGINTTKYYRTHSVLAANKTEIPMLVIIKLNTRKQTRDV